MFAGTIRYNLQLGGERTLTDLELEEACRQALCLDFINEMPDRFDTDLGAVGKGGLWRSEAASGVGACDSAKSLDPPSGRGDECVGQ